MKLTNLWPIALSGLVLTGCAGGWRNGPPPGSADAVAAAAQAPGPAGANVGVHFIYRGDANSVSLAGEFNGWNMTADPMTKQDDGSWQIVKKLDPGRYAYKFVIDGGTWKTDDMAKETVDDGYGGKNSLVVVGDGGAAPAPAVPVATTVVATSVVAPGGGTASMGDGVHFVYRGPGNSVNLAGELNGWNTTADPMTKQADGSWLIVKQLEPGRYAYKFVIDGGTWKPDDAAKESVDDGYGGKNSVVVVEAAAGQGVGTPAADMATGGATAAAVAAGSTAGAVSGRAAPPEVTPDGVKFAYAGAADHVHLAGDFNGWSTTSDPMTRQPDGTWTIVMKLSAGTYTYKFLVNGKNWKQDEANPETKDDGFGGKNSVVTVH